MPPQLLVRCEALPPLAVLAQLQPLCDPPACPRPASSDLLASSESNPPPEIAPVCALDMADLSTLLLAHLLLAFCYTTSGLATGPLADFLALATDGLAKLSDL